MRSLWPATMIWLPIFLWHRYSFLLRIWTFWTWYQSTQCFTMKINHAARGLVPIRNLHDNLMWDTCSGHAFMYNWYIISHMVLPSKTDTFISLKHLIYLIVALLSVMKCKTHLLHSYLWHWYIFGEMIPVPTAHIPIRTKHDKWLWGMRQLLRYCVDLYECKIVSFEMPNKL